EDPHERRREHLALVVDQGVMTWGPVRLVLCAAVLALGRLAPRRKQSLSIRCGSSPAERFNPPEGDAKRFGDVLVASAPAPNPGHALAEEVLDPAATERDIVVLTHPRVLRDVEVQRLAKVLVNGCRLFAVTATEEGQVEVVQIREGGIVPIRRFRMDFTPPVPEEGKSKVDASPYAAWTGDIEPIPFPFRFGLTDRVIDLAFDTGGRRLMVASVSGFLHVWTLADGAVDLVPRGCREGQVLKDVQAVLGVENGFVVCGRLGPALVAVNYDFDHRTAALHTLFTQSVDMECAWHVFPHLHSIALQAGREYRAIDLAMGGRYPDPFPARGVNTPAHAAVSEAQHLLLPSPYLPILPVDYSQRPPGPFVVHGRASGQIRVVFPARHGTAFVPMSDGRPRLQGVPAHSVQLACSTLALATSGAQSAWSIHDLDDDGRTLAEFPIRHWLPGARLSPDGRLFARQTANGVIVVAEPATGQTVLTTSPGHVHTNLQIQLGYRCMGIGVGSWGCLLNWTAGPLRFHEGLGPSNDFGGRATNRLYKGDFAPTSGRFVGMYRFTHSAVHLDCFGQIAFLRAG